MGDNSSMRRPSMLALTFALVADVLNPAMQGVLSRPAAPLTRGDTT
jgi:hypothetical protein